MVAEVELPSSGLQEVLLRFEEAFHFHQEEAEAIGEVPTEGFEDTAHKKLIL